MVTGHHRNDWTPGNVRSYTSLSSKPMLYCSRHSYGLGYRQVPVQKGHHQPFFTVRMSVMPHTRASAPVVKSQVTDSSSSNLDVGAALLWPDPKVQEPAPDPEWLFLQWARCQKMCHRFWNPSVQLAYMQCGPHTDRSWKLRHELVLKNGVI
ncbi:uncharacterized protein LOC144163623 isoform X1 [Haemaphysalis longicornis]